MKVGLSVSKETQQDTDYTEKEWTGVRMVTLDLDPVTMFLPEVR